MMPSIKVWEQTTRRTPLGLQVWDFVTSTHLVDGLEIVLSTDKRNSSLTQTFVNRSSIYCAYGINGLIQFELNGDDTSSWESKQRRYKIEIRDPADRYLPFELDAELPARGLLSWLSPLMSPPHQLSQGLHFIFSNANSSPPEATLGYVPLFSAPSRPVPGTLAQVRAQLREFGSDRPAAWCLLTVSVDLNVVGIGLADREGRVAILFPYPERAKSALTSPPSAKNDFKWSIKLNAYYVPRQPNALVPEVPNLTEVLNQLNSPRTLFESTMSPPQPLPELRLEYGIPLTIRTKVTATENPSSYLFVNTA